MIPLAMVAVTQKRATINQKIRVISHFLGDFYPVFCNIFVIKVLLHELKSQLINFFPK